MGGTWPSDHGTDPYRGQSFRENFPPPDPIVAPNTRRHISRQADRPQNTDAERAEKDRPFVGVTDVILEATCWTCLKAIADSLIPGTGSVIEVARTVSKVVTTAAAINEGRPFDLGVVIVADEFTGTALRVGLTFEDRVASHPTVGLAFVLDSVDTPNVGDVTVNPTASTVDRPIAHRDDPGTMRVEEVKAPLVAARPNVVIIGPDDILRLARPTRQVADLPHDTTPAAERSPLRDRIVKFVDHTARIGAVVVARPGKRAQIAAVMVVNETGTYLYWAEPQQPDVALRQALITMTTADGTAPTAVDCPICASAPTRGVCTCEHFCGQDGCSAEP